MKQWLMKLNLYKIFIVGLCKIYSTLYRFCVAVTFGTKEIQILTNVTNFDALSRKYVTNDGWKIGLAKKEKEAKAKWKVKR